MKRNCVDRLPEGYRETMIVDAKSTRFIIIMNLAALFLLAAVIVPAVLIIRPADFLEEYSQIRNLVLIAAMFLYIVLHELVHGLAYKLLTKQKLTFGITLTVAYCGVPNVYVYRKAAMIALLAPFLVFLPVFTVPIFLFENAWDKLYCAILLGLHISGCVGDLYDTMLYLFRFRSPDTLMRDTGPKQTFYEKTTP